MDLHKDVRRMYTYIETSCRARVQKYQMSNTLTDHDQEVRNVCLRLRQLCCHLWVLPEQLLNSISSMLNAKQNDVNVFDVINAYKTPDQILANIIDSNGLCANCDDELVAGECAIVPCHHAYCTPCITELLLQVMST